jgi:CubicO group peptidase (beta-lactamase class C family)
MSTTAVFPPDVADPRARGETALSTQPRDLPDHPSLRYLKIEAKRRHGAGEFPTLHDAQRAIAREHGLPSWTTLKAAIVGETNPALAQVRWVVVRFRGAGSPTWLPPDETELREHFADDFLELLPPDIMVRALRPVADQLHQHLTVTSAGPETVRARIGGLRVEAAAEAADPRRLRVMRVYPIADTALDQHPTAPPRVLTGPVPDAALVTLGESYAELGLTALSAAARWPGERASGWPPGAGAEGRREEQAGGGGPLAARDSRTREVPGDVSWAAAFGWADLDREERLRVEHRFPVYGTTKAITAVAVLRLIAEGRVELDAPADDYLTGLRLADGDVTVRDLLAHRGGVLNPGELFAERVPDQRELLGVTVAGVGRGEVRISHGGYGVLGRLLGDVMGQGFADATRTLVLEPLGMTRSSFPERWPVDEAVTGYGDDGPVRLLGALPAALGLWSTSADIVRFGSGWASLLPDELAAEALNDGLGWLVNRKRGLYGHPGAGPGGTTSFVISMDGRSVTAVSTNRRVLVESVVARLARPVG